MARTEIERSVLPSVLDRLTDHNPRIPADPPVTRAESVRQFRDAVMRDVEWLLNTRAPYAPVPAGLVGVRGSAYAYGLPDTTGLVGGAHDARDELLGWVRATIAAFEPRLADVQIELVGGGDAATPEVRFTLSALLCMDPSPEQVVFDTVLDPVNGGHTVRPTDPARSAGGPGGGARA